MSVMKTIRARAAAFGASAGVVMACASAHGAPPVVGGCQILPADNIWNTPVDTLPVHEDSDAFIATIGSNVGVHPDFGTVWNGAPIGIPFVVVPPGQKPVAIHFVRYGSQSDPGPYPVPPGAPIEGGPSSTGDRHVLVVDSGACVLYELYRAFPQPDGSWNADSGAVFDLSSHALRPETWTSADAAGLPILPGLVLYDEVASGAITHALRFTAQRTRRAYVWPARHFASNSTDPARPAMGQRFRLKAGFDESAYPAEVQVVLRALKKYGMILADNGSNWYISGAPDPRWDDDALHDLHMVRGGDFEAVDVSSLMIDPGSGQARRPGCAPDLDGDGLVGSPDLAALLGSWDAPGGPADLDQSGSVGSGDLALMLGSWGACP